MSHLSLARAPLPHIWSAEFQEDHGQFGPVPETVQPSPALGGHRGVPMWTAEQESAAAQEVYQDCSTVS